MTLALDLPPQPDSPLRALDPRWKLAAVTAAAATLAVLQSLPAVALGAMGAAALVACGRVPPRWYGARLALVLPFLGLVLAVLPWCVADGEPLFRVGPLAFSRHGFRLALVVALKALAIVSLLCVLLTAAPLHASLHAAHALRVPGLLVQLALLTYRYSFLLADEWGRLRVALRARAYRNRADLHSYRTVAFAAGMLLVRGHERAERVAQAMQCRAFDGRFRSLADFRTTPADVALFGLVALGCVALLALDTWRPFTA